MNKYSLPWNDRPPLPIRGMNGLNSSTAMNQLGGLEDCPNTPSDSWFFKTSCCISECDMASAENLCTEVGIVSYLKTVVYFLTTGVIDNLLWNKQNRNRQAVNFIKFFPPKIALPSTLPLKKIPRKNLCYPQLIGEQLKKKLEGSYHFCISFKKIFPRGAHTL